MPPGWRDFDFKKTVAVYTKAEAQYRDTENLRLFLDEYSDLAVAGVLVYGGSEVKRLNEKIIAIPWWVVV